MTASLKSAGEMKTSKQDDRLVQECLKGSEEAWAALINKYKNLIFSIPIKYGFCRDDATDVFQAVCLALVQDLPHLREPGALAAWLIQTTSRKCFRWKDERKRYVDTDSEEISAGEPPEVPEELFRELEREQILREALQELSPGCKRLIELLFLESPPMAYEQAAKTLGMAEGSIGATRMRCLEKLRRGLEKKGFR
jgi:RNA polymerase sigma factor (sigma-70 family)